MVPLSMTLMTSDPDLKVTTFFEVECRKNGASCAIAQEETIPHMEWYNVCSPRLTSKRVARVCQHQLSFSLIHSMLDL